MHSAVLARASDAPAYDKLCTGILQHSGTPQGPVTHYVETSVSVLMPVVLSGLSGLVLVFHIASSSQK